MKILSLLIILLGVLTIDAQKNFAIIQYTGQVRLSWDANAPAPEGYRVYQRIAGQAYDYSEPVWQGPETYAVINGPAFGVTHYYVVRAYDGELESIDSNEVSFTMASVPAPAFTYIGEKK
jgi:hypothetical protein